MHGWFGEKGKHMAHDCMPQGERSGAQLHRDNARFAFFHVNGKPELADDCEGTLSVVPIPQMIRQRQLAG